MSFSNSSTDNFSRPAGVFHPAANKRLTAPAVQASFVREERIVPTSTQNGSCVCASISSMIGALCAANSRLSARFTFAMSFIVMVSFFRGYFNLKLNVSRSLAATDRPLSFAGTNLALRTALIAAESRSSWPLVATTATSAT